MGRWNVVFLRVFLDNLHRTLEIYVVNNMAGDHTKCKLPLCDVSLKGSLQSFSMLKTITYKMHIIYCWLVEV